MRERVNFIFLIICLLAATLIGRLFFLQIIKGEFYAALAKGQRIHFQEIKGERGKIFFEDKNGDIYPVAINKNFTYLYVSPKAIKNKEEAIDFLEKITNLDRSFLENKLKADSLFEMIKDDLTQAEIEEIKKKNFKGIYLGTRKGRFYPHGEFASKVLGFVDVDGNGRYGIEGYYDKVLKGKKGFLEEEKGLGGKVIFFDLGHLIPARPGADLVSTIDYNLQFKAEKILEEAKETLDIKSGLVIILNPQNGEIKALANLPNYNPNKYYQAPMDLFQNDAIQKVFEPGSVFKPFTMAMGLDLGKITPETTYIDEGIRKFKGGVIYNYGHRRYGKQTMTNVLEKSINTGAVFVEEQVGAQNFIDYVQRFGFEAPTGIDLPGEVFSDNKNLKSSREINLATASFGQGIELTPIQLMQAYSALINGGKAWKPHIIKKIISDNRVKEVKPELQMTGVIKKETSEEVVKMLVSAVENGYARRAKIDGYYIGGKTGTAQVPWTSLGVKKSGYSNETIQSFMGFFPAYDPKFLVLIKLDNPKTRTAEYSAVPLFRELAEYIIDYYQIPPDY